MDDPRWLRLITVGLILAALVVGYSLLSGNFVKSKPASKNTKVSNEIVVKTPEPTPSAMPSASSATSAYDRIAERSKGSVQTLPKTGFSMGLAVVFSVSAIISGWSIRKFPH